MIRTLILWCAIAVSGVSGTSFAADNTPNWDKLNTTGLYKNDDPQSIARDIWKNYTQDRALKTLDQFPTSLQSSAYRSVMDKLLFADSRPLNEDVDTPLLLRKRMDMALGYGLFDSLEAFYGTIADSAQHDSYLNLIPIALIMKDGQFAPACLDIQASTMDHNDNPAWQDLANYCHQRFGSETSESKPKKFVYFKFFETLLKGELSSIPANMSTIETLVAFSDGKISPAIYNKAIKNASAQTDLFIALALNQQFKENDTYQCAVIEAAQRGIINIESLPNYYADSRANADKKSSGKKTMNIARCNLPAHYYNIFEGRTTPPSKSELNMMLQSTSSLPISALTPFAKHLPTYDFDEKHLWRAGTILAMAGVNMPENLLISPLIALQNKNHLNADSSKKWYDALKQSILRNNFPLDPAAPIHYLRIVSGEFSNLDGKQDNFDYENLFSLTYGKKSLQLGLGKIDAMSAASKNNNPVRLLMIAFLKVADQTPNMVSVNDIAGILSSLDKYKLTKEKETLAIEALSY